MLFGALVGGPRFDDTFPEKRSIFTTSETTMDWNCACARRLCLYALHGALLGAVLAGSPQNDLTRQPGGPHSPPLSTRMVACPTTSSSPPRQSQIAGSDGEDASIRFARLASLSSFCIVPLQRQLVQQPLACPLALSVAALPCDVARRRTGTAGGAQRGLCLGRALWLTVRLRFVQQLSPCCVGSHCRSAQLSAATASWP